MMASKALNAQPAAVTKRVTSNSAPGETGFEPGRILARAIHEPPAESARPLLAVARSWPCLARRLRILRPRPRDGPPQRLREPGAQARHVASLPVPLAALRAVAERRAAPFPA